MGWIVLTGRSALGSQIGCSMFPSPHPRVSHEDHGHLVHVRADGLGGGFRDAADGPGPTRSVQPLEEAEKLDHADDVASISMLCLMETVRGW